MDSNDLQERFRKLKETAKARIGQFSRIVEDMKRRSPWTFIRAEYVSRPGTYRFRVLQ